jgi:hypothetical protein
MGTCEAFFPLRDDDDRGNPANMAASGASTKQSAMRKQLQKHSIVMQ